jgi:hypothetical protein
LLVELQSLGDLSDRQEFVVGRHAKKKSIDPAA